ncbi:MAG: Dyp-type peroxidase [Frankiales bacterium]|nr:Dyp-type peroxidase [Frankiales bacterium]
MATAAAGEPGPVPSTSTFGADVVAFHGDHQAGVDTPQQAHTWFVGLDLRPGSSREDAVRLMRIWTDDAERLTGGAPALADHAAQLAVSPARLTVTLGLGERFFDRLGLERRRPASLGPLPDLAIDRLEERWRQTDLLLQVGADDLVTLSHAVRVLTRDATSHATVVWVQRGFVPARGSAPDGTTPRNLLGQVDGTENPRPGTEDLSAAVWAEGPDWFRGGTMLVLRRIRMDLDSWERLSRSGREFAVGRTLADGAPLTGGTERTPLDLSATDPLGFPVISENAHVRLAHAQTPAERMLRRGYSYDDSPGAGTISDVGLLFAAYVADIERQFVPVQRRLADGDLLNRWTTPVGSATYAIPPGVRPGHLWCEDLLGP